MKTLFPALALLLFCSCKPATPAAQESILPDVSGAIINPSGNTIESRFNPPAGYTRKPVAANSYAAFLRKTKLKRDGAMVHYYDGRVKDNPNIYAAVLTYDVGTKDLQQCADAVMRLRAEYLFNTGQRNRISFYFNSGFRADYTHWANGERISVKGNKVQWIKSAAADPSYQSFRQYLDVVYSYASTLSLSRQLQPVSYTAMAIGDVLIVGGSPGHAVTVMDIAEDKAGNKVYLLSQSYMPAQEIQVLHNPASKAVSPWYKLDATANDISTPQWRFNTGQLMRFPD